MIKSFGHFDMDIAMHGSGRLLVRKSGTEPVVRLYGEAGNDARLAEVMAAGRKFILAS